MNGTWYFTTDLMGPECTIELNPNPMWAELVTQTPIPKLVRIGMRAGAPEHVLHRRQTYGPIGDTNGT